MEMSRRGKVGGIIDRRFGENDPTMPPEERMLERFTREKQKRARSAGGELFNLEDEDELTHFGQSLGGLRDDFDASNEMDEDEDDGSGPTLASRKRLMEAEEPVSGSEDEGGSDLEEEGPQRKKSKAEVMKEVVAKSKMHKYERQKNKEDDDEEREKLDTQMGALWQLLGARQPSTTGGAKGANLMPLGERGSERKKDPETEYDMAVRELGFDTRAVPADKSKTDEEKAEVENARLRKLEEARQRRMRGEEEPEDVLTEKAQAAELAAMEEDDHDERGDAAQYGLGGGIPIPVTASPFAAMNPDELLDGDYEVSDDEDGYVDVDADGNLNSAAEMSDDYDNESISGSELADSDEEDFLAAVQDNKSIATGTRASDGTDAMAFVFPCPQTHSEMVSITSSIPISDHPTVVQRIRILHHAKLAEANKAKLGVFSTVLLEHILHLSNLTPSTPFPVLDLLIRHLHALAKTYPELVATAFRAHLKQIHDTRINTTLRPADLVLLTAVAAIFPTSDHFHQVATPAMIIIAKWLAQVVPTTLNTLAQGAYLITLCAQYQRISKRFVPEALNFLCAGLLLLSPAPLPTPAGIPTHLITARMPVDTTISYTPRALSFAEISTPNDTTPHTLLKTYSGLVGALSELYTPLSAFPDIFSAPHQLLSTITPTLPKHLRRSIKPTVKALGKRLTHSLHTRRPLELHHHRPLPIPSHIPKFEEDFNPDKKSYDHDVERRDMAKLKAEIKREKKGAVRELRKDSQFVARVKLGEEKKTSKEYHAKMAKIVARIQTEEGEEGNRYKREKARKG